MVCLSFLRFSLEALEERVGRTIPRERPRAREASTHEFSLNTVLLRISFFFSIYISFHFLRYQ